MVLNVERGSEFESEVRQWLLNRTCSPEAILGAGVIAATLYVKGYTFPYKKVIAEGAVKIKGVPMLDNALFLGVEKQEAWLSVLRDRIRVSMEVILQMHALELIRKEELLENAEAIHVIKFALLDELVAQVENMLFPGLFGVKEEHELS